MKLKLPHALLSAGFALSAVSSSFALLTGVTGVTGSIEQVSDNNKDLDNNVFQSDDLIRLFYEGSGILTSDLTVYTGFDGGGSPLSTTIDMGTEVRSYLIHWDPVTGSQKTFTDTTISFEGTILGFLGPTASLDATDNLFESDLDFSGLKGDAGRQAGFGGGNDQFATGSGKGDNYLYNPFTINKLSINGSNVDQIRIFTAIPEPATVLSLLLALGLIGMLGFRRYIASFQSA